MLARRLPGRVCGLLASAKAKLSTLEESPQHSPALLQEWGLSSSQGCLRWLQVVEGLTTRWPSRRCRWHIRLPSLFAGFFVHWSLRKPHRMLAAPACSSQRPLDNATPPDPTQCGYERVVALDLAPTACRSAQAFLDESGDPSAAAVEVACGDFFMFSGKFDCEFLPSCCTPCARLPP